MPVERDTLYNVVAEGDALAPDKPFRRDVRRAPGGGVVNRKMRIAAVSFLNARPITYGLEQRPGRRSLRAVVRAAVALRRAARSAARSTWRLIPSASYAAASGELRVVPGIAIAGCGPVRTVLLVGEVPLGGDDDDRARRRLAQLGDAAAPAVPRARPDAALPRGAARRGARRGVGHDAARSSSATPASRAAARYPHVYDLGARVARADRPALRLRGAGPGGPAPSAPRTSPCCSESLRAGLEHRGRDRARLGRGARRRSGRLRALPHARHPLPAGRRGAVGRCRRSSTARAPPSCCRAPGAPAAVRDPRARIAAARRPARRRRSARYPARRRRRRRAPVARRRAAPVRTTRRRSSWAPPPTRAARRCTPTAWSPTSSTATSTTRTSA